MVSALDQPPQPAKRPRSSVDWRFGLRGLLLFAILFCLLFGWIGRRYYRLRQDEAAIAALQRGGADSAYTLPIEWIEKTSLTSMEDSESNWERARISLGLSHRPRIGSVSLLIDDPGDERLLPALEALKRFPEIHTVNLVGPGFDDETLRTLAALPRLRNLYLRKTRVTGAGLALLADSPNLWRIHVFGDDPPEDLVAGLALLKRLRVVELSGDERLDRAEVATLASLPNLEELSIFGATPSGEADLLSPLEQARSLKVLLLDWEQTDLSLGEPPILPHLQSLTLSGIDDETLAKWPAPAGLTNARFSVPVTEEAIRAFSAAHPDCLVEFVSWYPPAIPYRDGKRIE